MTLLLLCTPRAFSQALITEDLDLGTWSPFMTRVQKSVPVCVWDVTEQAIQFTVSVSGTTGTTLHMLNGINDALPYRVHWLSGENFKRRERLSPGIPSRKRYASADSAPCAQGPTGLLRITVNKNHLQNAPVGIYSDTLQLTISPL